MDNNNFLSPSETVGGGPDVSCVLICLCLVDIIGTSIVLGERDSGWWPRCVLCPDMSVS